MTCWIACMGPSTGVLHTHSSAAHDVSLELFRLSGVERVVSTIRWEHFLVELDRCYTGQQNIVAHGLEMSTMTVQEPVLRQSRQGGSLWQPRTTRPLRRGFREISRALSASDGVSHP